MKLGHERRICLRKLYRRFGATPRLVRLACSVLLVILSLQEVSDSERHGSERGQQGRRQTQVRLAHHREIRRPAGIADDDIAEVELSSDAARNLVYLLVRRRDGMEITTRRKRLRDAQAVFRAEWLKRIAAHR